jgi:transglutaminase-like putative cysteine protease
MSNLLSRTVPFLLVLMAAPIAGWSRQGTQPQSRSFEFTYAATVTGLSPGGAVRIWVPFPPTDDAQQVTLLEQRVPGVSRVGREAKYGNEVLYIDGRADASGKASLSLAYRVRRQEVRGGRRSGEDARLFLKPDRHVPVGGRALQLIQGRDLPPGDVGTARALYDTVYGHMRYSKEGVGWGRGDADWACDSGFGNCSDFHSLFIALARAKEIPARFEIGFGLPPDRGRGEVGGYHCWAAFHAARRGWVPVDISEARKNPALRDYNFGNLSPDRVKFSAGRDLILEPKQDGPPLNFFVYPYVEVNGQPHPDEKVARTFTYRDLDDPPGR